MYSAKVLCGALGLSRPVVDPIPLTPGLCLTAVNIHNPHPFPVRFTKKALITNPQRQPRGKVSQQVAENLRPNDGVEVESDNVFQLPAPLPVPTPVLKGFVVLHSPVELDVVAVYTYKNVEVFPGGIAVVPLQGFGGQH